MGACIKGMPHSLNNKNSYIIPKESLTRMQSPGQTELYHSTTSPPAYTTLQALAKPQKILKKIFTVNPPPQKKKRLLESGGSSYSVVLSPTPRYLKNLYL